MRFGFSPFGIVEGSHRRFARKNLTSAVLLTVSMPWVMLGFAAGNGVAQLGARAIDRPRPRTGGGEFAESEVGASRRAYRAG